MARWRESQALRFSLLGRHAWAIADADEAVALWRPVAGQHPAAMARAVAVRAWCLHVRGRTAEAARDVEECLAFCDRAGAGADAVDLAKVVSLLDRVDRAEAALALADRLLADALRVAQPASTEPMLAYGELMLRHGRPVQALDALRQAYAAAAWWSSPRLRASAMLFEALAAAGRIEELEEHTRRDLPLMAGNALVSLSGRRLYIRVLELLEHHHVTVVAAIPAKLAKQRRKLLHQRRRWWVLTAALAVVTGNPRAVPDRP
ncbi:hypothetical protein GCM10009557_22640 [Virgisporangium ochraceum]|uniref:Tetratricopeptide repeat protein n=1 Tax=Virgisporangium ochraceum TaxID=65505 RepID=A0A8J3ZTU6_9ACTN|nr:hypothetical protein [Virgisporangium ochraceum]GIJ68310.1 hypothetical protein Voc01_032270 [Virgisporangium ochraceum]